MNAQHDAALIGHQSVNPWNVAQPRLRHSGNLGAMHLLGREPFLWIESQLLHRFKVSLVQTVQHPCIVRLNIHAGNPLHESMSHQSAQRFKRRERFHGRCIVHARYFPLLGATHLTALSTTRRQVSSRYTG